MNKVSFAIGRGEIFGFLGSNGCGKTTTMKVLTGLMPASEGSASLLGRPVDASDLATRKRVGFMSQSFSLYGELSTRQNLALHARLFDLPKAESAQRIDELIERFDLAAIADQPSGALPLGLRQRLSLAVAVLHRPEVLILDEPTSGVDPAARDDFWRLLVELSREQGVTIFLSTHFMNEAQRCDRISLMHAGRVLACDTPDALQHQYQGDTLEDAFVRCLEQAQELAPAATDSSVLEQASTPTLPLRQGFSLRRLLAVAGREGKELLRDKVRLAFALLGALFMMVIFGYGISLDVENLAFAVHDQDQSRKVVPTSKPSVAHATSPNRRRSATAASCTSACNARKSNWHWKFRPALVATCTQDASRWWLPGSTVACRSAPKPAATTWKPCTRPTWSNWQRPAHNRSRARTRCAWKRVSATTRMWSA